MRISRVGCLERTELRLPSFVTSAPSTDKALTASLCSKSVLDTILDDMGISSVERFQSTGAGVGNISMWWPWSVRCARNDTLSCSRPPPSALFNIHVPRKVCPNPAGMSTPTHSLGHSTYTSQTMTVCQLFIRSIVVGGSLLCLVFAGHDAH
jgi:hypothetical protein